MTRPRIATLLALLIVLTATVSQAQTAENVLIVVNTQSPASIEIGEYYAAVRAIPGDQIVRLRTPVRDEVTRSTYAGQIEGPIARWLQTRNAQDRILYIVLTKGVPLRISGTIGRNGTLASVDSELTLLYRRMTGVTVPSGGRLQNPYFDSDANAVQVSPFSHETHDIYLVTRLDGFSVAEVIALIDRGRTPATTGQILLDQTADPSSPGDRWLAEAAEAIAHASHDRVLLESTTRGVRGEHDVLGYYSWGSSDPSLLSRTLDLQFVPGAIAATYVGTSARTFTEPPETWKVGDWRDRMNYFEGTPESLIGDLVREGVTGVAGHVADPFLDGVVRPQQLFAAYLNGSNLAESYYAAIPDLSWKTIVIGDPLVAPFRETGLTAAASNPPLDPHTELPVFFSTRRLARLTAEGVNPTLAALLIQSEQRLLVDDRDGARYLLEQATTLDPSHIGAQIMLGELYQETNQTALAIERYRHVLDLSQNHIVALNNLAYLLMDDPAHRDEAFRLAQRAFTMSAGAPAVADTLGWIHHLQGNNREAARYLAAAVEGMPAAAQVRLHAATVYHALGQLEAATHELSRAVELDPSLSDISEVTRLRSDLTSGTDEVQ